MRKESPAKAEIVQNHNGGLLPKPWYPKPLPKPVFLKVAHH